MPLNKETKPNQTKPYLAVGNVDEHMKPCLSSQTQTFIRYYTFKQQPVERKGVRKLSRLDNEKHVTRKEKRANADFEISLLSVIVLTCLFAGSVFTGSCLVWDPFFGVHHKMESATFSYLHMVLVSVYSHLYLVTSPSQLTFKPESSPYFHLASEGRHIRFWWFHTCAKDLRLPGFF